MVPRLVRMSLALLLAAGVYLLFIGSHGQNLHFVGGVQDGASEEPVEGPGLTVTAEGPERAPEAIALERSEQVTGRVIDEAGKPVVDVAVDLVLESPYVDITDPTSALDWKDGWLQRSAERVRTPAPAIVEATAQTDAEGKFALTTKTWGRYRVRAKPEAPRYGTHALVHVRHRAPKPIELLVGDGSKLTGKVLDMADRPVAAFLVLSSTKLSNSPQPFGAWKSDPTENDATDGAFAFDGVPPGDYLFTCIVPGKLRLQGITLKIPREEPLVVRVPAGGASLVGTIRGPQQEPVPNADVLVSLPLPESDATVEAVGTSGADGTYTIEHLPAGPVRKLSVGAKGYLHHVGTLPLAPWAGAAIPASGSETIDVDLLKGAAVHGTVKLADGTPVPDVTVLVAPSKWRPPALGTTGPLVAQTNEEGAYRIEGVPIGKHVVFAVHPAYYIPSVEDVANRAGPPAELLVFVDASAQDVERHVVMAPGIPVHGVVLDPDDEPIADAQIVTRGGLQNRWFHSWGVSANLPSMAQLARSAADGTFEITSLPPRPDWVLAAKADGRLGLYSEPFSNETPRTEPITLRMESGLAVRGTVLDDDGPVAGINVYIWSRNQKVLTSNLNTRSKEDGTFEILGVPSGDANLQANDGAGRHGYLQLKGLQADEDKEDVELKLRGKSGVELGGVLVDEDGKPLPNYRIQARGKGPDPYGRTDAKGRFHFKSGPSGKIRFRVQQPGGKWVYIKGNFHSPRDDFELTFKPQKQRVIQGRVLGPDRQPIPLVQVQAGVGKKPNENNWRHRQGLIGQEVVGGTFKLAVTGEGTVWIRAQSARDTNGNPLNVRGVTKTFEEDDDLKKPVEIVLEEGLSVKGVVKGPEEEAVKGALVQSGRFMARTHEDGSFVMRGLPEGALQLYVQPPVEYSNPPQTKTEAGAEDVEIRLLKAAVLRGQVTDANGEGLTNGRVYARWKDPEKGNNQSRSAHLTGDGGFVIKGIPAGTRVTVDGRLWGRQNRGRVIQPKQDVDPNAGAVTLVAERGAYITGYVIDAQRNPVARVNVSAQRIDTRGVRRSGGARTNNYGEFRIEGLIEGEYKVHVQPRNSLIAIPAMTVSAPAENLRFQLPPSTEIRGRIDDPGGSAGWQVQVIRPRDNRRIGVGVKSDGSFVASRVAFDETWTIRAYNISANLYALQENVPSGAQDVVLEPQDGLTISGRVELRSGAPTKAYVYASGPGWSINRTSDVDGNFTIGPFPPGRFSMWVYQQNVWNNRMHVTDVPAGTSSLIVQLPK